MANSIEFFRCIRIRVRVQQSVGNMIVVQLHQAKSIFVRLRSSD